MKIKATVDSILLENDSGFEVESIQAVCSRCGHETESFGTSDSSIKRCLALLNEECPNGENNFYVEADIILGDRYETRPVNFNYGDENDPTKW